MLCATIKDFSSGISLYNESPMPSFCVIYTFDAPIEIVVYSCKTIMYLMSFEFWTFYIMYVDDSL